MVKVLHERVKKNNIKNYKYLNLNLNYYLDVKVKQS